MNRKAELGSNAFYPLSTLSCEICHKYFNGKKPYIEHLQSNNHKKKLKEKELLDLASQEAIKPQISVVHSDGEHKNKLKMGKKNVVGDSQHKRVLNDLEESQIFPIVGWGPAEKGVISPVLISKPERECKQFYVQCAVCQLYFTSQKNAILHFNSDDHKRKEAHHREIEELYNNIKNVDIQEVVENLLCNTPSASTAGMNIKARDSAGSAKSCQKPGIRGANEIKMPFSESRTKEKALSDSRTKEKIISDGKNEKKAYPGCELCGINTFPTIIASLNHVTTPEHCRRAVLQTEGAKFQSDTSNELPSRIPTPNTSHIATDKQTIPPQSTPLNPIGYERKQRHKQYQQSDICATEQQTFYVPDNCTFNYTGETNRTEQYFSGMPLNPFQTEYKYESLISSDFTLAAENQPQKHVSRPFPRLAAAFPQSNLNTLPKNLCNLEVVNSNQS